jgi:hypothetical protein
MPRALKKIIKYTIYITIAAVIIIAILFTLLILQLKYKIISPFSGEDFNQETWFEYNNLGNKDYICLRGPMVNDLKYEYIHIKTTTKQEVVELLGTPDINNSTSRRNKNNCIGYSLGMCSGMQIDYDTFFICFDDKDLINNIYTTQS